MRQCRTKRKMAKAKRMLDSNNNDICRNYKLITLLQISVFQNKINEIYKRMRNCLN